ncbi:MAG: putative ABC transporter permease [Oscillospiraceae bacterium]
MSKEKPGRQAPQPREILAKEVAAGEEAVLPPTGRPKKARKKWYRHKDVNNGRVSFAAGINIYKLIWVFVFGCVIGVAWETFYVFSQTGELMRRSGMLYGPFNQVYGIGAVLFTLLLYRYRNKNGFLIFLGSAVVGLVFEYLCSWAQELLFGSVSWEYSEYATNIGGRTNLLYGVGWGIMGLLFITRFWPWMSEMIERIPNTFGKTLTIAVAAALALNLALSGMAVFREKERKNGVAATNFVAAWLDRHYPDEYMAKKYPSMKFVSDTEQTPQESPSFSEAASSN